MVRVSKIVVPLKSVKFCSVHEFHYILIFILSTLIFLFSRGFEKIVSELLTKTQKSTKLAVPTIRVYQISRV